MIKKPCTQYSEQGFTLLEVVVSIVVAAILGTMLYQYSQTTLSSTAAPVNELENIQDLNDVMESITRDYFDKLTENAATPEEETGWIDGFGSAMATQYADEVDSITYELGCFDDDNAWTATCPSGANHIQIRLVKGSQSLVSLFSE